MSEGMKIRLKGMSRLQVKALFAVCISKSASRASGKKHTLTYTHAHCFCTMRTL